ncbi:Uncharacterized protein conserved in bacteria [Serratia quinivorans]|nr:Uncharacterized protein conserved in bacteria [Serratia quinivorans]
MKIIKPLRLSVLNRPFRQQGKNYLGVSVMALLDMGTTPQLRPEVELWKLAAEELQTSGGVIDVAIPKVRAEFLATGNAYTRHQKEKNSCAVRIDVGSLSKTLVAFGDRFWSGSQPTPPRNFGPLDMTWPRRFKRMGKAYDANWLKNDFPGLARDADWRVFNAASPDQWWPEQDELPPEAEWRIWNMYPEIPLQSGKLPPWRARCFINRQRGDETLILARRCCIRPSFNSASCRLRSSTVPFLPFTLQRSSKAVRLRSSSWTMTIFRLFSISR